jgi:hypothetical protein
MGLSLTDTSFSRGLAHFLNENGINFKKTLDKKRPKE